LNEITREKTAMSGKGKVLVMDDEELIRTLLGESLAYLGYQCEFAEDGDAAITHYKEAMASGEPFRVVIMDLTIPGGRGAKEAIGDLIEADPDVVVVISSGYSGDPVMADFEKYGFKGVLSKPYTMEQLDQLMRSIIGR
jgi:DNA-binding NtrC family response regulator